MNGNGGTPLLKLDAERRQRQPRFPDKLFSTTTLADTTFRGVTDKLDGTYSATTKALNPVTSLTVIVNGTGLAVAPVTVTHDTGQR